MALTIAGAQIPVTSDVSANVTALRNAIDFAAARNADLLLTPEGSLSGYHAKFDLAQVREALVVVTDHAKAAKVALALGTCFVEPDDQRCYNQLRFYAADGRYLGFHSKTLCCGTLGDKPHGEINDYAVKPLRTFTIAGTTVGGLICNDMWANPRCTSMGDPHLATKLAQMGAQLIVHAVNGGSRDESLQSHIGRAYHAANLPIRALAAETWIVSVDNCDPQDAPCSSPSGVIAPDGSWAHRCKPTGQELFTYTIDL